ncbi:MAG: LysM peptidoglycan-binding domain-containing protein [Nocardioides sp.]
MSTMVISPVRLIGGRPVRRPVAARPTSTVVDSPAGAVRLTRRGRLVVFLTGLLLVLVVGFFLGAGSVASQDRGQPAPTEVVQVAPGETLWDIASRLTATGDDVRGVMYDIKRLNALDSSGLTAGQRLRVPAGG